MFNKNFIFNEIYTKDNYHYYKQDVFNNNKVDVDLMCITLDYNDVLFNLQSSCSVLSLFYFSNKNSEKNKFKPSFIAEIEQKNSKIDSDNILILQDNFNNFNNFNKLKENLPSFLKMITLAKQVGYSIPKFKSSDFINNGLNKKQYKKITNNDNSYYLNNLLSDILENYYYNNNNNTNNEKYEPFFQLHNLNSSNAKTLTKEVIGGKAHGLTTLIHKGFNVPKALVFDTKTCLSYLDNKDYFNESYKGIYKQISDYLIDDNKQPLLVSVRSGAPVSLPGMMDSILNIGIDDSTYSQLCKSYTKKVIDDCTISFMNQFCNSKFNLDVIFSKNLNKALDRFSEILISNNITCCNKSLFPLSKEEQIKLSIEAVFDSWNYHRAIAWRNEKNISHEMGTAATVQQMVLGNKNDNSLTCVIFSRDCITGKPDIMGEYLPQVQGEDLVSGKTTPLPISHLKISNPKVYREIEYIAKTLEEEQKAIQDIEITVEDGKVYVLQMRNAVISPEAQLALAKEMNLNLLDVIQPKMLIGEAKVDTLLECHYNGLAGSPGLISGIIVRNQEDIDKYKNEGKELIFFSNQALPEHAPIMIATQGFITEFGGATSHAAILARSMGKPCIVGIGKQDQNSLQSGSLVTIDASEGKIWQGELPIFINQESAIDLANQILKDNKLEINDSLPEKDFLLKVWTTSLSNYQILNKKVSHKNQMFLNIAQKTALILQREHKKYLKVII